MSTAKRVKSCLQESIKTILLGVILLGCSVFESNAQVYKDRNGNGLIEISFIETLDSIRFNLTGTCPSPSNCTGYELMRSLDFSNAGSYRSGSINTSYTQGSGWNPIGDISTAFNAIFEGHGYTIDNLFINRLSTFNIGLFGYTESNTRIRNIGITNVSVSGSTNVGALVGRNVGTITQSYATGSVSGINTVGALVGKNSATIMQSYATGNVTGSSFFVGGLVGENTGTITQSYATGNVSCSSNVGALVGSNSGTITHGYWNKDAVQTVGGVIRSNSNKIGIGTGSGTFVRGLTLSAMKSPTATPTDSIQELGPGFLYYRDRLPKIHTGARVTVNTINFTQAVPSSTNIISSSSVTGITHGTATTRATLTVDGKAFTANIIGATNITGSITLTNIQNGDGVKKPQILTFTSIGNKTFGDSSFVLQARSSEGLKVSYSASNILVSIRNDTLTINGAGTVSIKAYQTGDHSYLKADSVVQILTISKARQSINFGTLQKTFGHTFFILSATSSAGLKVSYSASNTLISISNDTLTIKGAGTVSIKAYQTGNDNYIKADSVQILTISKARQSISFGTLANKTFGDAFFILSATSSAGLKVSYSASNTLISISNDTLTINGAGTVIITAFQTGNDNYLKADSVQILTISKANQSITFGTLAQRTFGDAFFVLSATSSAGLTVLYSASNNLVGISNDTLTINGAGTVNITAYNIGNSDYAEISITQILTIIERSNPSKTNPTINFTAIPNLNIGQKHVLIANSNSPVAITFTSSDERIATISGNTLTAKAKGNVTLTANQEGNTEFNAAFAIQNVTITDPTLLTVTITFTAIPHLTIGQKYTLVASSNSPVAITFASSNERIATISGNILTAVATGNVTITANQAGNEQFNAAFATQNVMITDPTLKVALITFTAIPNLSIGQKYVLIATSNSPVAITFTSSDNDKLSIIGNTATAKAKGNVALTANQAGNAEFNAAAPVVQNVTVLDPTLQLSLINFNAIPSLTIGQKYTLMATSNSPVAIIFTSSNERTATISGNTLTAVGTGTAFITANQAGNAQFNATTAQQTLTVINKTGTTTPTPIPALTFIENPNNSILIFPNPANDYITISYDKTHNVSSVKIYDMTGKSYELKMSHDTLGMKADIKNLPKGEYILVIYGEKGEVLKRELLIKKL